MPDAQYDAFISYRRSDGAAVARWLRRALESYRPPRALRDRFSRKLRVYLDTAYERGTSDFYEHNIKPALLASRYLVVVATPAAVRRTGGADDWMHREVTDFAQGPNGGNVVAVRGAGEFDDPLPSDLRERFPNIEIIDLRGAGPFTFLNPVRAARLSAEKLKLVAPLLDLAPEDMPQLRQEEEKRQQGRVGAAAGVTLAVVVAVSSLSIFALQSRFRATRALESSMFATGRMVQSISRSLSSGGNTSSLRSNLINEGCDLIDKLRIEADREAPIDALITCREERGREHEQQQEPAQAQTVLRDAIDLARAQHDRSRSISAAIGIVQAREHLAAYHARNKDQAAAEAEYRLLLSDARRLAQVHKGRHEIYVAEAEALGQLGDIAAGRKDHAEAARLYDEAADAVGRAVEASFQEGRRLTWLARLHRLAGEQHIELKDIEAALKSFARAVDARARFGERAIPADFEFEAAISHARVFEAERRRSNAAVARKSLTDARVAIGRLLAAPKVGAELRQRAEKIRDWIKAQEAGLSDG